MTWVKICGMTNLEDALVAVEAGADAVGFVFYEKSPRCVSLETAREIVEKLPREIEKIGVFVGPDIDPWDVLLRTGLTGTQSYITAGSIAGSGARSKAIGMSLLPTKARFLMAMPMSFFDNDVHNVVQMVASLAESKKKAPSGSSIPEGIFDTLLLDSGNSRTPGGTGEAFDWRRASGLSDAMHNNGFKLIVAGGLKPENVGQAIEILHPWGVDVSSGVEERPGKKDPEKVRAFVRAVREMDRKVS